MDYVDNGDNSGSVTWDAALRPFGGVESQLGSSMLALRLPGQYVDEETGRGTTGLTHPLYCNYHRDYDPAIGRYVLTCYAKENGVAIARNAVSCALSDRPITRRCLPRKQQVLLQLPLLPQRQPQRLLRTVREPFRQLPVHPARQPS